MKKLSMPPISFFLYTSVLFKRMPSLLKFSCGILLCISFNGCLETPHSLEDTPYLYSTEIFLIHENGGTSPSLQTPRDTKFSLCVKTTPAFLSDSLEYFWHKKDSILSKENPYSYTPKKTLIPDSVSIKDKAGNSIGMAFEVILNTGPKLNKILHPTEGDTLYGDSKTPFLFSWEATDIDGDTLQFYLEKGTKIFPVGILNYVHLSNFSEGIHKIRIIAKDKYNNTDTSATRTFYVMEQKL